MHCHCALVSVAGQPVAFANLWTGDGKSEVSVDLMRHASAAPKGVMDYRSRNSSCGGCPRLPVFQSRDGAVVRTRITPARPLWHRIGTLVFRHGEHFYNFEDCAPGQKFHPEWRPKYLVASRGLGWPSALIDVAALIRWTQGAFALNLPEVSYRESVRTRLPVCIGRAARRVLSVGWRSRCGNPQCTVIGYSAIKRCDWVRR